jgi:hypothetical protein
MPSESKPLSTLMAMASRHLKTVKTRGSAQGNPGGGAMKPSGGGPATMMGHALSGTQFGQPDSLIRKAQDTFARFASGGAVKKPAAKPKGPSLKERKEIRALIERGKTDAVSALHATRDALLKNAPSPPDVDSTLGRLRGQLAMKDGGEVESEDEAPMTGDPAVMYQEYSELMEALQNPKIDPELQAEMMDRMMEIENSLGMGEEAQVE